MQIYHLGRHEKGKEKETESTTVKEKYLVFKNLSKYNVRNVLTEKGIPLSDLIHGPYMMIPPEPLHTLGSGLIMYPFRP